MKPGSFVIIGVGTVLIVTLWVVGSRAQIGLAVSDRDYVLWNFAKIGGVVFIPIGTIFLVFQNEKQP